MSNRTSDSENDRKSPGQDILGLILFGLFGFAAVSIFLHLRGQVSESPVTMPVNWLVNAVGSIPGMVLALGTAGLGLALFLRPDAIPSARHAVGVIGLAIGAALVIGGIFPEAGGKIGSLLPALLGGTLGLIAALLVGSAFLVATVVGVWLGSARANGQNPLVPSALVPTRKASSDGVSAAEAMALQTERAPEPFTSSVSPPAPDVRVGGGIPTGAMPLELDDEREANGGPFAEPDLDFDVETAAQPAAGELAHSDLAPDWEDEEGSVVEEAGGDLAAASVAELEVSEPEAPQLGAAEHGDILPPAPAWELAAELDEEEEAEEEFEEEEEPEEELAAELDEEEEAEEEFEEEEPEEELAAELDEEEEAEEEFEEEEPEEELAAELDEEEEAEEEVEEEEEPEEELAAELDEEEEAEEEFGEEEEPEEELAAALDEEEGAEEEVEEEVAVVGETTEVAEVASEEFATREVPRPGAPEQMGLFDEVASAKPTKPEPATSDTLIPVRAEAPAAKETEVSQAPAEVDPARAQLFEAGVQILEENRVAVSMLERRFTLDFDGACALLDQLQELGLIGPYMGGRNREILLTMEEWRELEPDVLQVSV